MENCIFCKIINGELPCYKVYEDEKFLAFLDINPITPGHTLVIPKKHSQFVSGMSIEDLEGIMPVANRISLAIRKSGINCEDINFEIADGEAAGQEIAHMHMHLIPRFTNDGYGYTYPAGYRTGATKGLEELAEKIKTSMD